MASRIFPLGLGLVLAASAICADAGSSAVWASTESPKGAKQDKVLDERNDEDARFLKLVDAYFDQAFKLEPSWATAVGIHTYDSEFEDYSKDGFKRRIDNLHQYLKEFQSIDAGKLNKLNRFDCELVINHIKANLLSAEDMQLWRKNPDTYSSNVSSSIFGLIKRDFAPLKDRMQSVIERERRIPKVIEAAKANLDFASVPRIFTEIALEQLPGIIGFFETSVPEAVKPVSEPDLQKQFADANNAAIASLKDYDEFLKRNVENSKGNFALGEANYKKKLAYEEMVDTPLPELLDRGYKELHRLQQEFISKAHELNAKQKPEVVFEAIASDHPTAKDLLQSVRGVLEEIRKFTIDKNIVTMPSEERARVEETPAFMRALTFASMDTPGPFEKKATEAYYHVTVPEASWSKERTEEHLRTFSYPDLLNTSVHEAYPGHYTQFLWAKQAPSKVRKLIGCGSNDEGWAHYCEQMMLDEGFRQGDAKLKLVQIHDALLRVCRYICGIEMHTHNMTVDGSIKFFMKEGYVEHANAEREAKRGTMDPTYLVYTLGKLEILAMRDEYKRMMKDKYSLAEFHDRFLGRGFPPLRIVRAELLGDRNAAGKESAQAK